MEKRSLLRDNRVKALSQEQSDSSRPRKPELKILSNESVSALPGGMI